MNATTWRGLVLLLWMMANFGVCTSCLAQQAGLVGATPVMPGQRVPAASTDTASLTPQQRQWLSQHDGLIRIGITVIPPQVLLSDGQYKGLSIDYIHLMEGKLGCRFILVPYTTWNEVIQAAKARQIDMIFAAQQTPERLGYLLFAEPYIELPNMIVVRKDQPGGADLKDMKGWRVTASQGSAVHEYLKREFPYLDLRPVPDELSGLMKVSMGEADAMVVEISRASYYIEKAGILNLRVSGNAGLLYRLGFAVRKDWPVLCEILDKGLSSITDKERRDINRRWVIVGEKSVFTSKMFWIAFAVGLTVITLAVAGAVVWNRTLRRVVRQRTSQLQQELAKRKQAEDSLLRLNRQLRAISTCNQVLMKASDEQTLLDEICRIVCQEAGYRMAWVGYRQTDDARTIRPVAWAGVEEGYLAEAGIIWADTQRGRGPAGRAVREGVSACIQDFATDPQAAPWRESALQRGYRSSTALPLKEDSGTPFGALCIYSTDPNAFTPDEIRLLEELAGNLAFGITTLRIRAEHKKAEMQLHASEQLFRALVENSPDFIARYDLEFRRIYFNPAIEKLFGSQARNALGTTPADRSPLYAPQIYIDHLRQAIETATESTAEIPFRTAESEMHWGHLRFVPEFGPDDKVVSVLAIGRDIHEIKENEQRFRMLAENFPDFVVRFNRHGQHTYVNSAVEKAYGMPAEAIVGKTLQQVPQSRTPEQNDALLALIRRAFDEGVANESEALWDTEMGERIFEIRHAPEKDATGNVVSVLSIARDITERKQMEQERLAHLRYLENMDKVNRAIQGTDDLEKMMKDLLDTVLSIFECDRDSLVYPCDPQAATWQAAMERTKPECPGAYALELEVPMDPDVVSVCRAVLASNDPVGFGPGNEHPLPTDVAKRFNEHAQLAMAIYPKIDKPYMFVIHQCVQPRVWTQEERRLFKEIGRRLEDALTSLLMYRNLHDSEARYRMVFENSPVSIWEEDFSVAKTLFDDVKKQGITDIETYFDKHPETVRHCAESTKIIDVNRAALALHGAANKEELLADLVNTFTPESFDTFRRGLVCLWKGGTGMTADAVVKTIAGDRRHVTVYFSVCPGHEETLSKVLVSLIDITERRQAEEELSRYREHLEELVKERTAQLETANKELEAFAYSVSHDLRAPLRHIEGFLELLQKKSGTTLDDQGRHYMDNISDAAQKMGLLIDDLLSFSRMGRQAMCYNEVDLGTLVRDVIRELEPDTVGRNIAWRIGELPVVSGDGAMLRMVLTNLISNALKFTRPRQQAQIEIGSPPGRNSEAVIFVRDNGVGFDMSYADRLFGVFQRLHSADEFEGTGIGLANVRRIVARHGGRTWAEGESERGAAFFFSLPQMG